MEFFHKVTRFPFMNTRKVWYGLSAVLIVASLGLVAARGLNLGVDFHGGGGGDQFSPGAEHRTAACFVGQGRRRGRASAGLRQFAGYPRSSAAGSERQGR